MEEKGSVKKRLEAFLKAEGVTKSEFGRIMDISPAYVASMRKSMSQEKLRRLLEHYPRLNRDWLLYGEGEMYIDDTKEEPEEPSNSVPLIPVDALAGQLTGYSEGVDPRRCPRVLSPVDSAELAIRVTGTSMEPQIPNGSLLYIRKINDRLFIPWNNPLVLDTENGVLVKVLKPCREKSDCLEALSYNPDFEPLQIPKDSIYGIYRIVAMVQEGFTF